MSEEPNTPERQASASEPRMLDVDFEPDFLDDPEAGKEPSIRALVLGYYQTHMDAGQAKEHTDRYIAALTSPRGLATDETPDPEVETYLMDDGVTVATGVEHARLVLDRIAGGWASYSAEGHRWCAVQAKSALDAIAADEEAPA